MATSSQPPNMDSWNAAVTRRVFNVTVDGHEAEQSDFRLVYLADLASELKEEQQGEQHDRADRVIPASSMN